MRDAEGTKMLYHSAQNEPCYSTNCFPHISSMHVLRASDSFLLLASQSASLLCFVSPSYSDLWVHTFPGAERMMRNLIPNMYYGNPRPLLSQFCFLSRVMLLWRIENHLITSMGREKRAGIIILRGLRVEDMRFWKRMELERAGLAPESVAQVE